MNKIEKIIILIFGKRGSGKSFLTMNVIRPRKRLLIYDTIGEYTEGVIVTDLVELQDFWGKVYQGNFRVIYQPVDPEGDFDSVCREVCICKDLSFVVEELDRFARPLAMSREFKEVVQRGRHHRVELIGITQRPHGIDKLLTSQAKQMLIFNTTEPRDIDYFKDVVGYEVVKKIAMLEEYQYVKWTDGSEQLEVCKEKDRKWDDLTMSPDE